MRLLFVQVARDDGTDYGVHQDLVDSIDDSTVGCFFVRQRAQHPRGAQARQTGQERTVTYDFGRDYSTPATLSRSARAVQTLTKWPPGVFFTLKEARAIEPDAIYTSIHQYDVVAGAAVARTLRVPHIIHLHYTIGPWLGRPALAIITRSRSLIAVSEFIRQNAILSGVDGSCVRTVHNPIDPEIAQPPTGDELHELRRSVGVPEGWPVVLAAGRLEPSKGFAQLLESFALLCRRRSAVSLLICGAEFGVRGYEDFLKRSTVRLGIKRNVIFAGWRSDLRRLMAAADVFCLPTELEPFGLVFLEAMLAGTPVVACQSGAVPEIVADDRTGLLSLPGDHRHMAANLESVLADHDEAARLGRAGQERAQQAFGTRTITPEWISVVRQYIGRSSGSARRSFGA